LVNEYELPNIWAQGDALVAQDVGEVLVGSGHLAHIQKIIPVYDEWGGMIKCNCVRWGAST
jgi:hypothetical protein